MTANSGDITFKQVLKVMLYILGAGLLIGCVAVSVIAVISLCMGGAFLTVILTPIFAAIAALAVGLSQDPQPTVAPPAAQVQIYPFMDLLPTDWNMETTSGPAQPGWGIGPEDECYNFLFTNNLGDVIEVQLICGAGDGQFEPCPDGWTIVDAGRPLARIPDPLNDRWYYGRYDSHEDGTFTCDNWSYNEVNVGEGIFAEIYFSNTSSTWNEINDFAIVDAFVLALTK
jgi:hypothetical protein